MMSLYILVNYSVNLPTLTNAEWLLNHVGYAIYYMACKHFCISHIKPVQIKHNISGGIVSEQKIAVLHGFSVARGARHSSPGQG
jgi:hypothetical protein